MELGIARVEITPPVGIDLTGFGARLGPSIGVHDPLYATALVAEDAGRRVALVSCDLIGLGAATVARLRAAVERQTGIPATAQMYACTHTHGGPETGIITSIGRPNPTYLSHLERSLTDVVIEAAGRLAPARIGWAAGACHAAHNRVLARAGQDDTRIDPDLKVVRITGDDGSPRATLLHYTCHPTAAGAEPLVNADWCAVVRDALEAVGAGTVLIVNGAGGDINARMEKRGFPAVEKAGRAIADVAGRLWSEARPTEATGVDSRSASVPLELLPLAGADEIAALWARWQATVRDAAAGGPGPDTVAYRSAAVTYRDHALRLARYHWGSERLPAYSGETQVLRIGPLAIVSLPGEFFSAYGMQIKAASPAPATLIAGWTNDNRGYFPTAEAFPIGGYEMDTAARWYGYPAPWAPAAGAAVTERAIALVRSSWANGGQTAS